MYKKAIVNNLIKLAGILGDIQAGISDTYNGTKERIFIPVGDKSESMSERLGYTLGELIGTPNTDNDDLGPYKDVVKHIKDTELAEAYLRAAADMRRKARIIKRKREEDEGLRSSVARSRFF